MEKLTEDFIQHIKKADDNPRETAIQFMLVRLVLYLWLESLRTEKLQTDLHEKYSE